MPLEFISSPYTPLIVTQINPDINIYLDQWALVEIATSHRNRERFKHFLKNFKADLRLSWLHVLEFLTVTDQSQIRAVENFLTEISPGNIGFIEVIPRDVIKKENIFLENRGTPSDPYVDKNLLKFFSLRKKKSPNLASFDGFFKNQNEEMKKMCRTFLQDLNPKLEEVRSEAIKPKYKKNLTKVTSYDPKVQYLTRYLNDEINRYLLRNKGMKMIPNHWRDMLHLIVPMAFCQYVLVDRTWYAIGNLAQMRLLKAGHKGNIASLFCNIEEFFSKIKSNTHGKK